MRCRPKDPPRLLTMSHSGSSPKAVRQKENSINEQVKKNKLFFVKRHGKVEIKQRGKDGKLRPLNRPENFENYPEHGPNRSATSPRYFSAQMDRVERKLVRNTGTEKAFAETDTPPTYQTPIESKGIGREAEDYDEDFVFHLSARDIAAERDRAEREIERIIGTGKELPERRRQGESNLSAPPHPGPPHAGPHQGFQNELAGTESAEKERRRGESNHPGPHLPDSQREHLRGQSKHHQGSQHKGESAQRERLGDQSNHHPDPQRGLAETERAEKELRGRSNRPTSPLSPQSTSPRAAGGPKNRPRRGA